MLQRKVRYVAEDTVTFTATGATTDAALLAEAITNVNMNGVSAEVNTQNKVVIKHSEGGEIKFTDTDGALTNAGFAAYVSATSGTPNLYYQDGTDGNTNPLQLQASNWKVLTYTASDSAVTALATQGQLWYSSVVDEIDIMIHNGTKWVGYSHSTSTYS